MPNAILKRLILAVFIPLALCSEAAAAVPWREGEPLGNGWVVSRIHTHPEFVRLDLRRGERKTQIEINRADRLPPKFPELATRLYRLQPGPTAGGEPELQPLLKLAVERLRGEEKKPGHAPFVAQPPTPSSHAPPKASARRVAGWLLLGALVSWALIALWSRAAASQKQRS